jgi:GNAT superfamily N-acetyltransferase
MTRSVRIASVDDAEQITLLINSAFRIAEAFFIEEDRINLESVQNYFAAGTFLLATIDEVPAACVYVEPRSERAYLGLLSVDPARQHDGLGKLLMDAAEEFCRRLGCRYMDLNVVSLRKDLFGFYGRRGYVEIGTSPFPADVVTKLPCHFIDMSKSLEAD